MFFENIADQFIPDRSELLEKRWHILKSIKEINIQKYSN